jgi:hypothetical protein
VAARQGLSDEASVSAWLAGGPGVEAANDVLAGRAGTEPDGQAPMSFTATIAELRADCEHLAAPDTDRSSSGVTEARIALEHVRSGEVATALWGGE